MAAEEQLAMKAVSKQQAEVPEVAVVHQHPSEQQHPEEAVAEVE